MGTPKVQILPLGGARPPNGCRSASNSTTPPNNESTEPAVVLKKTRASKPKVRSGCTTCKIRRVKCDETHPECNRCTSTGRKCDGYAVVPRKNAKLNPEPCLEVVSGTPEELRALEFFYERTAPNLSSYFDAAFWTKLVFQMSHCEPAIRHAMVAAGALNQQGDLGMKQMSLQKSVALQNPLAVAAPMTKITMEHDDPFVLSQYNKAIAHLGTRLKNPDAATEVALLACILFVCIEFLRGDVEPAVQHFKSGMGIAMASMSKGNTATSVLTMDRIKENMLPFFNRLELLSMQFGQYAKWDYPTGLNEAVPGSFHTITQARDSLVHLMNLSLRFIRRMRDVKYDRAITHEDIARMTALQQRIEQWEATLDVLLLSDAVSSRDLDAAKVLRIHHIVTKAWLATCIHREECSLDRYMEDFKTAVILGEAVQSSHVTREQRRPYASSFLFDMEIISPLYFVAINCRHPVIRRRAIDILRQVARREGLWDSNTAAAVGLRIATIEEVNLTTLDGTELPAERDRVHNTEHVSVVGQKPHEHSLIFYTKPNGLDQPWHIWSEIMLLDSYFRRIR